MRTSFTRTRITRALASGLIALTVLGTVPTSALAAHLDDDPWHRNAASAAQTASALLAVNTASGKTETAPSGISAEWSFSDDETELYHTIRFPFDPPPVSFRIYYKKPGESVFTRVAEFTPLPTSCDTEATVNSWTLHKRCGDSRWEINSPHRAPSSYTDGDYRFYLSSINGSGREHASQEFSLKYPTTPPSEAAGQTSATSLQSQLDAAKAKVNDLVQQIQKRTSVTPSTSTVSPTPSPATISTTPVEPSGVTPANVPTITRNLSRGTSGDDVKKLQEFLAQDKSIYPEGLATGFYGALTEAAVKRFQEKHGIEAVGSIGPKTRSKLDELAAGEPSGRAVGRGERPMPLSTVAVGKTASRGASGEHVKKVQEFLGMFPEIYPNGLATGFYGEQTEKAVKKFQEKVGLAQTGEVDDKTKDTLDRLLVAGEKKKPPKITDVTPASGSAGITVTLSGRGFTDEDNAIMMRGKIVATALASYDNNTQIDFILTSEAPCAPGSPKPCPIKVVNANGISNAKPFKLESFIYTPPYINPNTPPEPEPEPLPEPVPPPPPPAPTDISAPVRSGGSPMGELAYGTRSATLSLTTDENATCKYASASGTLYSSMTLTFSTTGGTTHSTSITGFADGTSYTYYARCSDSAGNVNADDYTIAFSVAAPPKPIITMLSPSKGVVGTAVTITGSGFTAAGNTVSFAGVDAATNLSSADGKTLAFSVPTGTSCTVGSTCAVSVRNVNGTSNESAFLLTQPVTPVQVVFPNGNENLVQGVDFTLSWTGGTDRVDIVLVEEGATQGTDPGAFIVGWVAHAQSPNSTVNWNVKTVCSDDESVCTDVAPGKYKLMALSENELGALTIWDDATNLPGNWDLSNSAFIISPSATLTVVVPNGGEIGSQNSAFIICWATIDLKSQAVNIELLKNGALYRTITSYRQASPNGAFITNWSIPGDIPEGADYQVKISDAAVPQVADTSDGPFSITAAVSAIRVNQPNGSPYNWGEIWYSGFDGPVNWYSTNILSKTVHINLWKGGFFYRNLATNVSQTYYGGGPAYTTGWFYRQVKIPADVPTGQDYKVEIVDAANPSIRDFSDYDFAVVQYPSYLAIKGRFSDYLNKTPLVNTTIQTWDGSYWWSKDRTNANGEFNLIATTSDLLLSRGHSFWAYPANYEYKYWRIQSNSFGLYAYVQMFPFIGPSRSFPVTSGDVDLGEIPFWPFVDWGYTVSDIPVRSSINYRSPETGQSSYNLWPGYFSQSQYIWKAIPQALDVWARIEDKPGTVTYSPMLALPQSPAVPSQTLAFFNRAAAWEPYAISAYAWYYPQLLKIGTPLTYGYAQAYGGVAPYRWSVLSGSLPPGITLSSLGAMSGAPTAAGVFDATLLVQDANNVHGVVPQLRFDVRTTEGAQIATIKVTDPQARVEMYPGGTYTIAWDSFGILSKTIRLDLYKAGSFARKIAGFAQGAEAGRYYYNWSLAQDIAGGNDYYIRISDMNDPTIYGESDVFLIREKQGATWSNSNNTTYSPYLWFQYATTTNPNAQTFKLYQQAPGEAALTPTATFTNPQCYNGYTSGKWGLYFTCYSSNPDPQWTMQYLSYASASAFPSGEYRYEFRAADSTGNEITLASWKLRALQPTTITYPASADSPLSSASLTPTIRWTVPQDWPQGLEKSYRMHIYETFTGKSIHSLWGLSAPSDTTGFRKYDGPALDPTKKYSAAVVYQRSVIDPATAQYTEYISMSTGAATFWFDTYVPPPAVSVSTESIPAAMIWTSYNTTLTAAGGVAPYKWSIVSGALPQGLYLDASSGRIYGWTSQQGVFAFAVGITDSLGGTATKNLSIEVKTDTGVYWGGGSGPTALYSQSVRFGYTTGKPADVTTFKLYQRKPGELSFSAVGTFAGITETCGTNISPADSLWRLSFACGTTYRYWNASLKNASTSAAFPVGEYNYYVTAIGGDGQEVGITPVLKQFALDRTKIVSPTETQSPIASSTLKFEWTVAQTNWPSGVSRPYFYLFVYPEGSYNYVFVKWTYGQVGVSTASYVYNGVQLDQTKKYIANIWNYPTTVMDSASFTKVSYISMLDTVTRFWVGP